MLNACEVFSAEGSAQRPLLDADLPESIIAGL